MAADVKTLYLFLSYAFLPDVECPVCHFDAMAQVTVRILTADGVTERMQDPFCGRCRAEERRAM